MPSAIQKLYLWACRRLYSELAWAYDAVSRGVSAGRWTAWRRLAISHLPPSGRVLEIGFGTGELLLDLAAAGREVYGVEPSRAMQRITGRKLVKRGRGIGDGGWGRGPSPIPRPPLRLRAFAQALPFADGYFGAVVATFPAEYIFDRLTAVEIARVLSPGNGSNEQAAGRNAQPGGCAVIGPFAVSLNDPGPARLLRVFYGAPPQPFLDRWLGSLASAGLRPRVVQEPDGGATAWLIVAEKETG